MYRIHVFGIKVRVYISIWFWNYIWLYLFTIFWNDSIIDLYCFKNLYRTCVRYVKCLFINKYFLLFYYYYNSNIYIYIYENGNIMETKTIILYICEFHICVKCAVYILSEIYFMCCHHFYYWLVGWLKILN